VVIGKEKFLAALGKPSGRQESQPRRHKADGGQIKKNGTDDDKQGPSQKHACDVHTEDLEKEAVIIRHDRAVHPPEIFVRQLSAGHSVEGIQIAAMIALGKQVLEIKVRPHIQG